MTVSDSPWDGKASRFTPEEYKRACAACEGKSDAPKTDCYLPHHEPDGTLNKNGVINAASRFNQTKRANTDKAKSHLAAHYRNDLKMDVPPVLGGESKSSNTTTTTTDAVTIEVREPDKPCIDCDDEALGLTPEPVSPRAIRGQLTGTRETRLAARSEFEFREVPNGTGGTDLIFTGYACVTGVPYEMEDFMGPWTESVEPGSFTRPIAEKHDVSFLLNHEGMTLARTKSGTLRLFEDSVGLGDEARLDPKNPVVIAMRSGVERGDLDEQSFAFRANRQEWNDDYTRRWIRDVNMNQGDVSLVNHAANPATGGLVAMRKRQVQTSARAVLELMTEIRQGKQFSSDSMTVLTRVLELAASADENLDELQPLLAELIGVPNPDEPEDGTDMMDQMDESPAVPGPSVSLSIWRQKLEVLKAAV